MDIHAGIIAASILVIVAAIFVIRAAFRVWRTARKLSFYSLRRMHNANIWWLLFLALCLFACAFWLPFYGEPMVYDYFPPSLTPSLTPTITSTPTITLTPTATVPPTLTLTPSVSSTPTLTLTPFLPLAIEALFQGEVTPNPDAVFTAIQFSTKFDGTNPIDPKTVFDLPIQTMYGGFDYNNTIPGAQWTALWYHDGKLVCYETKPWDGGTGGIGGYTECSDPIGGWLPGEYEVQIFMGYEWMRVNRFIVRGASETSAPTSTPVLITETPTP
jgi:type VI secretion system secreted protein VgrG